MLMQKPLVRPQTSYGFPSTTNPYGRFFKWHIPLQLECYIRPRFLIQIPLFIGLGGGKRLRGCYLQRKALQEFMSTLQSQTLK